MRKGFTDVSELMDVYRNGSPRESEMAMELIITQNEPLIVSIINKYYRSYIHCYMDDMLQEGRQAIFEHVVDFDPDRGAFSTFVTPYIIDAIKTYICSVHGISSHYASQIKRYNNAVAALAAAGNKNPSFSAIAEKMGVGVDAVQRAHNMSTKMNPVSIDGDEKERELASPLKSSPEQVVEQEERKSTIARALQELTPFERSVIVETYFNDDGKETPLRDVADTLGSDVSTVRRAKNLALRKLQESAVLSDYSPSRKRRELEDYAEGLVVSFILPEEAVAANVEIALSIEDYEDGDIRI